MYLNKVALTEQQVALDRGAVLFKLPLVEQDVHEVPVDASVGLSSHPIKLCRLCSQ